MDILLQAFVLGAIGGVIPGAVITILFVSSLQGGFQRGIRAFAWAMFSEIVIAGVLLLVAVQLRLDNELFSFIGLVGGAVLLYFAWQVYQLHKVDIHAESVLFTPSKIFLLSATNAPLYIFWTTVCFPLIWKLAIAWTLPVAAISYFVVFEIGWGITTFIMLTIFVFSRTTLTNERIMHKVFIVVASILGGFGVHMLIQSLSTIL